MTRENAKGGTGGIIQPEDLTPHDLLRAWVRDTFGPTSITGGSAGGYGASGETDTSSTQFTYKGKSYSVSILRVL